MMCKMCDNPRVLNEDSLNISSSDDGLWRKKVWRVWFNPMKQNAGIDMFEMEMKDKKREFESMKNEVCFNLFGIEQSCL